MAASRTLGLVKEAGGVIREVTRLERGERGSLESLETKESAIRESDVVEVTKLILEISSFFGFVGEAEEAEERGESSLSFLGRLETEEEGFCLDFLGESALEEVEPGLEEEAGRSLRVFLRDFEGASEEGLEEEEKGSLGGLTTLEHGGDGLENRKN